VVVAALSQLHPIATDGLVFDVRIHGFAPHPIKIFEKDGHHELGRKERKLQSTGRRPHATTFAALVGGGSSDRWDAVNVSTGRHLSRSSLPDVRRLFSRCRTQVRIRRIRNRHRGHVQRSARSRQAFVGKTAVTFPVTYDLSLDQMRALGLYISAPKAQPETDRPFAEQVCSW